MFSNLFVGFGRNIHRIDNVSLNAESHVSVAVLMFVFTLFSVFCSVWGQFSVTLYFLSLVNTTLRFVMFCNLICQKDYSEICWY
jgi:hypothetical protein